MRQNNRYLFVAIMHSGKTTQALKVAKASGKRIVVLDDIVHPAYEGFDVISESEIPRWRGQNCIVIIDDFDTALKSIETHLSNVFVISEDSARFLNATLSNAVRTFIINHRKFNFDIAFMFHYLGEVPPYLCKVYNRLVLFKTGDNMEEKQAKWLDWHLIVEKHKMVMKSSDKHACVVISKG